MPICALILLLGSCQSAQNNQATPNFDPRDLTGFWIGPPPSERPKENAHPPFTAAGQAAQNLRLPNYISKEAKQDDAAGCRNATCSNDPIYSCNPIGFPRHVWEENEPVEITTTPGRILQLFQWGRTLREIWVDGRTLPSGETLDSIGPNWYGHSVGEWQGDTLVINSTGFNEKAWPDQYGHPLSFDARIEERYKRIDADTIEAQMIIHDPKNYTGPWGPLTRRFDRMKPNEVEFFGWKGLFSGVTDGMCAPMNEVDDFNKRIRDRAIFGDK
jgi:hypothetical protein